MTDQPDPKFRIGDCVTRGMPHMRLSGGYVVSVLPDARLGWMYALAVQEGGVPFVSKVGEACMGLVSRAGEAA